MTSPGGKRFVWLPSFRDGGYPVCGGPFFFAVSTKGSTPGRPLIPIERIPVLRQDDGGSFVPHLPRISRNGGDEPPVQWILFGDEKGPGEVHCGRFSGCR
jgi:hypothetical protein